MKKWFVFLFVVVCSAADKQPVNTAKAFIDEVESKLLLLTVESSRTDWIRSTYITGDTELVSAKANERTINATVDYAKKSTRYDGLNSRRILRAS